MIVGPVVKIDPSVLPVAANIHYLGPKSYDELPSYIAGWDVALLPFARNEATRYHQPDQDARVPRRRQARGLHLDPRRRAALRQSGPGAESPTTRRTSSLQSKRRSRRTPADRLRQADAFLDPDLVGRDLDAHVSAHQRGDDGEGDGRRCRLAARGRSWRRLSVADLPRLIPTA